MIDSDIVIINDLNPESEENISLMKTYIEDINYEIEEIEIKSPISHQINSEKKSDESNLTINENQIKVDSNQKDSQSKIENSSILKNLIV